MSEIRKDNGRTLHPKILAQMAKQRIASIDELSAKTGIARRSLYGYLFGDRLMPFPAAGKISGALGMTLERLLAVYEDILSENARMSSCVPHAAQGIMSGVNNKYSFAVYTIKSIGNQASDLRAG